MAWASLLATAGHEERPTMGRVRSSARQLVIAAHRAIPTLRHGRGRGGITTTGPRTRPLPSMLDSLFIILRHTTPVVAGVRQWLRCCTPGLQAVHSPLRTPKEKKRDPITPGSCSCNPVLPIAAAWHLVIFLPAAPFRSSLVNFPPSTLCALFRLHSAPQHIKPPFTQQGCPFLLKTA